MQHTLKQQIDAIQKAHSLIDNNTNNQKLLLAVLNDAASTIASLNLIKSLDEAAQLEFLRNIKDL